MLRDFKLMRRNSSKNSNLDEMENIPINPNTIEGQEVGLKSSRVDKTPTKASKSRYSDAGMPLRTPDRRGVSGGNRFGWPQKNEASSNATEMGVDLSNYRNGNGGHANMTTPRSSRAVGRGNSSYSESNSTQSTPTKSVTKPPNPGLCLTGGHRLPPANGGARVANFAALSKGIPISSSSSTVVNSVEVPHFAMKEDPSFWMDHNVQVLIRVRPLNSMEKSTYGYNRCLKQESAQCITWVGQPETRFTFDHVACETVDQETLFKMVGLPMVENCLSGYNSCMFAYGQTGSGKTYTMLGDIDELGIKLSLNRGMTPRIFEFLFARIRAEEESRRDERLTYNCKCSFLEIYNEQITDLLDPTSTNLLLREDIKTGVYVENLSEFEVQTVADILKLLSLGSSNRKVAATNMNRESSRSHSVFTCVIESRWEKDSTSNLRFARLNLVDLAGSERQKTSGAEGERLKEAASINKSLSTLGHVIMVLVDVAHAKTRHVPYRDSRLTFLLQDSLGGNSKTMIIANVSPSVCSAAETLNTLKFAQRAKLIQNNAVVNEDSSGDVIELQHQIRLLKEELLVLKRQNVSRSLSFGSPIIGDTRQEHDNASKIKSLEMERQSTDEMLGCESKGILKVSSKQLKCLETTLMGALRREQMAETSIKQLEAEIEHLNRLVRQREEDTRCTKMMLKFREEKIQRMESLLGGLVPADAYLLEENNALSEEIKNLRAKVDKNPEVTRFALENIRLLEQLRRFQDFYEEGEREMLLTEVSELRDQLVLFLDGNLKQHSHPNIPKEVDRISEENASLHLELKKTLNELEECRSNLNSCLENNAKLRREIDDLHVPLDHLKSATHDYDGSVEVIKESILEAPSLDGQVLEAVQQENGEMHETLMKHTQEVVDLQLELDILKTILKEERSFCGDLEDKALCLTRDLELAEGKTLLLTKQYEDVKEELREAKSIIEALQSQQLLSISEMEDLRNSSNRYVEILRKQELEISSLKEQTFAKELKDLASSKLLKIEDSPLQIKLKKMHDSLDKAKRLNMRYQSDIASHASNEEEMDEVRRQVEAETAEVIVCLQEELGVLQQEVHNSNLKELETEGRLMLLQTELKELQENYEVMTQNNKRFCEQLEEKDKQLKMLSGEWESVTSEIEVVLAGGQGALEDASDQLDSICGSFRRKRTWISEQLGRMTRSITEKELMIEELNRCLENANTRRNDLERMLSSLRGAALVITEAHQQDCTEKEEKILLLRSQLSEKTLIIAELENRIKHGEGQLREASTCATAAFMVISRFSEINCEYLDALKHKDIQLAESKVMNLEKDAYLHNQAVEIDEGEKQICSLRMELEVAEEDCSKLRVQLSEEKQRVSDVEQKLEEIEENNIPKTRQKLAEKEEKILLLTSQLTEKTLITAELENKIEHGEEQLREVSTCATVAFVVISRFSEIKCEYLDELKHKDIQLAKSEEMNLEKDAFLHNQAIEIDEGEKQICSLRMELEVAEEDCSKLRVQLSEEKQRVSDVEQKLEEIEENNILKTRQKLTEKEENILLLTSQLSEKTLITTELESKIKHGEEQLRGASTCATVAFVVLSRFSDINCDYLAALKHKDIQLAESKVLNLEKDACLHNQAVEIDEGEKQICSLRMELEVAEEDCSKLRVQLSEEKQRVNDMERKLDEIEENNILKTRQKLTELKDGVLTLKSCMNSYVEKVASPEKDGVAGGHVCELSDGKCEARTGTGENQSINCLETYAVARIKADISDCPFEVRKNLHKYSSDQKSLACGRTLKDASDRDATIALLKEEIESALESLKGVQIGMAKLRNEKEDACNSENRTREGIESLLSQVLVLQEGMGNFEEQVGLKMVTLDHKLQTVEETMQEFVTSWSLKNESFESELSDSKMLALQKTAETSCVLAKFGEAQDTIRETDIMVNELMIANETNKLEIKRMKKERAALVNDRDILINEVQSLQSSNNQKDWCYESLVKQFESDFMAMKGLVEELEDIVSQVQTTFKEDFISVSSDFLCLKSELHDSTKLMQSWVEDIWSEIIVKDCAVSVLHLCHMGILLETVTGLNAENGLLHHGLCESNSLVFELREHNFKSRRELEMCRVLEGKLLSDIKNSFDRVSRKEDETGQLTVKLTSFEKKIADLQLQEELMLQRSNYMGSELAVLMKELDSSNRNVLASLLVREKLLKDKEDALRYQEEKFLIDLSAKDFHLLVLASELEQMATQKDKLEKEQIGFAAVLDKLKKNMVLLHLDAELKEWILVDNEVEVTLLSELQNELDIKNEELTKMRSLEEENESWRSEVMKSKAEYCSILQDLEEKKSEIESSLRRKEVDDTENHRLQDDIFSLQNSVSNLQTVLDTANAELNQLRLCESELKDALSSKTHDLQIHVDEVYTLKEENVFLRTELRSLEQNKDEALSSLSLKIKKCAASVDHVDMTCSRVFNVLNEESVALEKMFQEMHKNVERASEITEEFESLENLAKELISENVSLRAELERKDDVLEGLLFDLRLLQESASSTQDQNNEIEQLLASLEALENELSVKSHELDEAVGKSQILQAQLQEKIEIISTLELDISREREHVKSLSHTNLELTTNITNALQEQGSIEEELTQRRNHNVSLEQELLEMGTALEQMNSFIESLKIDLNSVTCERDDIRAELLTLKKEFQMAQALAEEHEAIAVEARQVAESRKLYADEKEEEVRLLERSVEELECTVNVLESNVDFVKGEAELQRLQREELELELHDVKQKMQNVEIGDAEMKRGLDNKEKSLQEALQRMQILEREIAAKDTEIGQCKAHISELNLHAEAQACEYKQKFKALEVMAEQVKSEGPATNTTNSSTNKIEKTGSRARGSGSPFKCMGLGLVQQIKSERDDELIAGRLRIEELETLAAQRQKEIFMLNTRLATAESMTHDVLRDLLGLKSDMNGYASLLDNQQVQKITEKARLHNAEVKIQDQEVIKLKQQLSEFVEERKGWLEEIDRKQAEIVAAQIALEKLRQRDRLLTTENEMFKMENVNHKKKVMELEAEVKKLSGQQNIQQRIHHHAKIKEENNLLKAQNEDLCSKMRRSEAVLSRVKEELAHFRATNGRSPCIHFDEEQRLNERLKETEEERLQLAHKLLGLCTSILKAAGVTRPASDISLSVAEEALEQLKDRANILDRELQEVKLKNRITNERNRLSELMPQLQSSPLSSRAEGSRQSTPNRVSQTPFLSSLDR